MKEQKIQKKILDFLESRGCYAVNIVEASKAGIPDILACLPCGHFIGIEVKKNNGVLSKLQKVNIRKIQRANGIAFAHYGYDEFLYEFNNAAVIHANSCNTLVNQPGFTHIRKLT